MKILIVSDYAVPKGGAEALISDLRGELSRRGHEVRLFSTDIGQDSAKNFADFHCKGSEGRLRTLLQTWNSSAARGLRRALEDFQPDIVHVRIFLTQLSPAILPLLRDRPALYHLAWYRAVCPTGLKHLPNGAKCTQEWGVACLRHRCVPLQDWPLRMIQLGLTTRWLPAFDLIVSNSKFVADRMAQEGIATRIVPNGIAVPELPGRPDDGFADHPVILFAGRLEIEKGCAQLLSAFRLILDRNPGAELVIAGDGSEKPNLEAHAQKLGLGQNVRFAGHLPGNALRSETRRAWMQVVPSLWEEPFGIAAVDGMMQARPIISSPFGGLAEIVEDGVTGYLIDPADTAGLADRACALISDRKLAIEMGVKARTRAVARFGIARCADDFEKIYGEIAG